MASSEPSGPSAFGFTASVHATATADVSSGFGFLNTEVGRLFQLATGTPTTSRKAVQERTFDADEPCWEFQNLDGAISGPFTSSSLAKWYIQQGNLGTAPANSLVRYKHDPNRKFCRVQDLFGLCVPFSGNPRATDHLRGAIGAAPEARPTVANSVAGESAGLRTTARSPFLDGTNRINASRSAEDAHSTDSEDSPNGHVAEAAHTGLFESPVSDSLQSSPPPSSGEHDHGHNDSANESSGAERDSERDTSGPEADTGSPTDDHEDEADGVDEGSDESNYAEEYDDEDEAYSTDCDSALSDN
jgi:hypothetical protein